MAKDGTGTCVSIAFLLDLDLSSRMGTARLLIMIIIIILFPYFGQGLFLKKVSDLGMAGKSNPGRHDRICLHPAGLEVE
jgi:hypothetical protein